MSKFKEVKDVYNKVLEIKTIDPTLVSFLVKIML